MGKEDWSEIKKRQSDVVKSGRSLEDEIIGYININLNKYGIKAVRLNVLTELKKSCLSFEFSLKEKREYMDADIVVVDEITSDIICVLSVKRSLRERGAQTAFWALKKKVGHKDFAYVFVTPDVDQELLDKKNPLKVNKWRNILTYETDGVFIWTDEKFPQGEFEKKFYVGKEKLLDFLICLKDR